MPKNYHSDRLADLRGAKSKKIHYAKHHDKPVVEGFAILRKLQPNRDRLAMMYVDMDGRVKLDMESDMAEGGLKTFNAILGGLDAHAAIHNGVPVITGTEQASISVSNASRNKRNLTLSLTPEAFMMLAVSCNYDALLKLDRTTYVAQWEKIKTEFDQEENKKPAKKSR